METRQQRKNAIKQKYAPKATHKEVWVETKSKSRAGVEYTKYKRAIVSNT